MRWIYISPHLDDAILSAGGLIFEQARAGNRVEIWSVVCGFPPDENLSPFAQALHFLWGFASAEETVRARRAEDMRAAEIVGARTIHFDFPDCIYRRGPEGSWLYGDIFVPPHPAEAELPHQMAGALAPRLERGDRLVCPLAIGSHVDHILVRRAVEALGLPLWYYADIPYLLNQPSALDSVRGVKPARGRKVSSEGVSAWQEGIAAYASQIGALFESAEKMREAIFAYARRGFRLWKPD